MSWKIHNGMILRDCTLEQGLAKVKVLRERCLDLSSKKLRQLACEHLIFNHDLAMNACWLEDDDDKPVSVSSKIREAKKEVDGEGTRSPDWDFTLELSLIPWNGHLLVLYFLENDPGYTDVMADLGFEEYYYYNNTDKPGHVTEQEWSGRYDAWQECGLMSYQAPSTLGLCYQAIGWHDIKNVSHWWFKGEPTELNPNARRAAVATKLINPELAFHFAEDGQKFSNVIKRSAKLMQERTPEVLLADIPEFDLMDLI